MFLVSGGNFGIVFFKVPNCKFKDWPHIYSKNFLCISLFWFLASNSNHGMFVSWRRFSLFSTKSNVSIFQTGFKIENKILLSTSLKIKCQQFLNSWQHHHYQNVQPLRDVWAGRWRQEWSQLLLFTSSVSIGHHRHQFLEIRLKCRQISV